ncbi:hypothetical protein QVN42_15415 [Yersinia nurmii]|uniref:Uncharacterized protein n=1 Tax=Yersinia nurmii TaxID=685706 RepID=A0AAW7K1T4_9GAMM|nr:hypothetical protein [Yersinia nurmii]MDN0088744.1 hypothetical protein [Yersinia nurmii]
MTGIELLRIKQDALMWLAVICTNDYGEQENAEDKRRTESALSR